ncbi:hypothetical protein ACSAZK_00825 [Methanosarcina sp. Mfa9]|uniref:hypothetical protein n=1 Tax=Methanosarcina sp. Mfa9 TaxID=3439063 RepID=UPI003F857B22
MTLTSAEQNAAESYSTETDPVGTNPIGTNPVEADSEGTDSDEKNSAELNSTENEEVPVEGAVNFMVSMLEMAELNTRLINATLSSRVSDYPFLATTIEGTSEGVEYMDSVLTYLGSEQQIMDENNFTDEAFTDALLANESYNESIKESFNDSINDSIVETISASLELLNESIEPPQQMMDNANSTLGAEEETTELIGSIYESVKLMVSTAE